MQRNGIIDFLHPLSDSTKRNLHQLFIQFPNTRLFQKDVPYNLTDSSGNKIKLECKQRILRVRENGKDAFYVINNERFANTLHYKTDVFKLLFKITPTSDSIVLEDCQDWLVKKHVITGEHPKEILDLRREAIIQNIIPGFKCLLPVLVPDEYRGEEVWMSYTVQKIQGEQTLEQFFEKKKKTLAELNNQFDDETLIAFLTIIISLIEDLQKLHALEIVHRDIKPANVTLTQENRSILIDFEKSAFLRDMDNNIVGNLRYSASEALVSRATQGSDVYSLATLIFELMGGKVPDPIPGLILKKASDDLHNKTNYFVVADKILQNFNFPILDEASQSKIKIMLRKMLVSDPASRLKHHRSLLSEARDVFQEVKLVVYHNMILKNDCRKLTEASSVRDDASTQQTAFNKQEVVSAFNHFYLVNKQRRYFYATLYTFIKALAVTNSQKERYLTILNELLLRLDYILGYCHQFKNNMLKMQSLPREFRDVKLDELLKALPSLDVYKSLLEAAFSCKNQPGEISALLNLQAVTSKCREPATVLPVEVIEPVEGNVNELRDNHLRKQYHHVRAIHSMFNSSIYNHCYHYKSKLPAPMRQKDISLNTRADVQNYVNQSTDAHFIKAFGSQRNYQTIVKHARIFERLGSPINDEDHELRRLKDNVRNRIAAYIHDTFDSNMVRYKDRCASDYRIADINNFLDAIEHAHNSYEFKEQIRVTMSNMKHCFFGSALKSSVRTAIGDPPQRKFIIF